ncbi:MAG: type II toxin-antitoxin system Phd/YefM family antitoxin [Bauldia sp.]|uniref:type II toxin-antitoxin system Phd/YefM family antitoxin n=1 Tax=Bauldia sp. TaxID=2575872 RepID=UPI001D5380CA|nr:type II toxin-antitoxin system prevent-host-death family antitoxin [Bauldia sp.]MCB1497183.1 type II toxin-antitoxin system Phd/YefM family antitoxin [Bauldia sp.]
MTEVGSFEAKNTLSALLERAEHGEEIVITRRGRPVAKLVPYTETGKRERAEEAARRIRERARAEGGYFDWEEWKAYRDAGRR